MNMGSLLPSVLRSHRGNLKFGDEIVTAKLRTQEAVAVIFAESHVRVEVIIITSFWNLEERWYEDYTHINLEGNSRSKGLTLSLNIKIVACPFDFGIFSAKSLCSVMRFGIRISKALFGRAITHVRWHYIHHIYDDCDQAKELDLKVMEVFWKFGNFSGLSSLSYRADNIGSHQNNMAHPDLVGLLSSRESGKARASLVFVDHKASRPSGSRCRLVTKDDDNKIEEMDLNNHSVVVWCVGSEVTKNPPQHLFYVRNTISPSSCSNATSQAATFIFMEKIPPSCFYVSNFNLEMPVSNSTIPLYHLLVVLLMLLTAFSLLTYILVKTPHDFVSREAVVFEPNPTKLDTSSDRNTLSGATTNLTKFAGQRHIWRQRMSVASISNPLKLFEATNLLFSCRLIPHLIKLCGANNYCFCRLLRGSIIKLHQLLVITYVVFRFVACCYLVRLVTPLFKGDMKLLCNFVDCLCFS